MMSHTKGFCKNHGLFSCLQKDETFETLLKLNGIRFQTYIANNLAGKTFSKGAEKLEAILKAGICDRRALYVIREILKLIWE